jgi:predicted nucleic acid-binding protein
MTGLSGTLVDSNVLLDIFTEDDEWFDWSAAMLEQAGYANALFINPIIYAEVSIRFARIEDLDEALPRTYYRRVDLPWAASFLAGHAYLKYRRAGGTRRAPLPDFYIGAHAAVSGLALLTRDARRYRSYFPTVRVIAP